MKVDEDLDIEHSTWRRQFIASQRLLASGEHFCRGDLIRTICLKSIGVNIFCCSLLPQCTCEFLCDVEFHWMCKGRASSAKRKVILARSLLLSVRRRSSDSSTAKMANFWVHHALAKEEVSKDRSHIGGSFAKTLKLWK